ncbi:MAG: hydrogenase maturation protease [Anaerolineae bacterium]
MRTIVVAVGNAYRRDDGVGRHIVNAVLRCLGRDELGPFDDGYDDLGHAIDCVVLHQMVPELAETVVDYDRAVFVDAHVPGLGAGMRAEALKPEFETTHLVSHQFKPSSILALAQQLYGRAPEGLLLSLPGLDFDFGEELSPEVAAMVPGVVERILSWAGQGD